MQTTRMSTRTAIVSAPCPLMADLMAVKAGTPGMDASARNRAVEEGHHRHHVVEADVDEDAAEAEETEEVGTVMLIVLCPARVEKPGIDTGSECRQELAACIYV